MRQFARLTLSAPILEDTTIMNFRHFLEKYQMAAGILETINGYLQDKGLSLRQGTITHAPSSTQNIEGKRDPEIIKGRRTISTFFGMKAHFGADTESGLVHHVHGAAANAADVTEVAHLLHGVENVVCADAGYTGIEA